MGCKDIEIKESEFVAKIPYLCITLWIVNQLSLSYKNQKDDEVLLQLISMSIYATIATMDQWLQLKPNRRL